MSLHRSALSALALSVMLPLLGVGTADAAFIRRTAIKAVTNSNGTYRVATTLGNTVPFYTVTVESVSPAGNEDIQLEESDAWLHGTASLTALPTTDATVALTLYDAGSASLMSFSGVLGADGAVTLTADTPRDTGAGGDCASRTGCDTSDTSDTTATTLDIEVLASEVFGGTGGYDLGIDLAGADTYQVAYASITVTEGDEVVTCDGSSRTCTPTGSATTTRAEVGWDEIGSVWEGDLTLAHEGLVEVKVRAWDAAGKKLEAAKSKLGMPWADGGEGVGVLATDEDPLTTVGLLGCGGRFETVEFDCAEAPRRTARLTVASSGWSAGSVPVDAKVELTNGEPITIPVNSYHRRATGFHLLYENELRGGAFSADSRVTITGGSVVFADHAVGTMTDSPICASGVCFMLVEDEEEMGQYALSVSVYGSDARELPDDLELSVAITDERGTELVSEEVLVELDDDITALFANEVGFSEDPTGLDLTGNVSLLGAANRRGKQETLAKGKFHGSLSRDGDGDLSLAGADKDTVSPRGDSVVAGDPVAFELTRDTNEDGVLTPPPLAPLAAEGQPVRYYTIELEAIVITN
ncbi:MAG: hypothetical protein Q8P18_06155 [Pseudomonadota bacterium]|nr:hypothetical protein [Pseudomonadota bacterium]